MSTLLAVGVYAETRRSLFAVTMVFVVVVPGIVSGYTLWLVSESGVNTVVGFSGVNAALLGYIPVLLFRFFHETVNAEIRPHHALAVVAVVLAVIFSTWSGVRGSTILLGGLGVVGVCLTWWLGRSEWRTITTSAPHSMLVWSATIVFLGGSYGMFVNTSPSTNIYGHLSGFVAGVAIPTLGSIVVNGYESFIASTK
jgi:membrane associated rhomboid family serine protease